MFILGKYYQAKCGFSFVDNRCLFIFYQQINELYYGYRYSPYDGTKIPIDITRNINEYYLYELLETDFAINFLFGIGYNENEINWIPCNNEQNELSVYQDYLRKMYNDLLTNYNL